MHKDNESYFTRLAEEHLIRHDERVDPYMASEAMVTHDTSKWGPNPPKKCDLGYGLPFGPPVLDIHLPQKAFNFKLNTDKTFMISTAAFPRPIRLKPFDF